MREIDPKDTPRAEAFELFMEAPMPMVTVTHTFNVTKLIRFSKQKKLKLNMLLCWCIGKAASVIPEFFMLPVNNKFLQYDKLAVNIMIITKSNELKSCDVPFSEDLSEFVESYEKFSGKVYEQSEHFNVSGDFAIVSTSVITEYEADSITSIYCKKFSNPFLAWGKIRHSWFKYTLPISFQFHHVQMDGLCAMRFLKLLQTEIDNIHNNFV